ncbi:MAG TPA: hypothetical protein VEL07_19675, partial [Planctomycetota bacterium]|nr:hypothetical protein [Planctomycetota bacterium]
MDRMLIALVIASLALALGAATPGWCEEELDIGTTPDMDLGAEPGGADDELTLETDGRQIVGGTRIRFAPVDDPEATVDGTLYWRGIPGVVSAHTTPVTIEVDGSSVIAPVRSISDAKVADTELSFPHEGRAKLDEGDHTISPGEMRFRLHHGELSSDHPALACGGDEIAILCAPIRFDAADAAGALTPVPVSLRLGKQTLLRAEASFAPLIIWLPVGNAYDSNFGSFAVTAEGAVKAERLAPGVSVTDDGLRMAAAALSPATSATQMDAELVDLNGMRLFVAAQVAPGGQVVVASAGDQTVGFSAITGVGGAPPTYANATPAPTADQVRRAAEKLAVDAEDLAWSAIDLPTGICGAFAFDLRHASGSLRHAVLVSTAEDGFCLVPYRARTAFEQGERQVYQVLMPDGFAGGDATVRCARHDAADAAAMDLGRVALPAVRERAFDSRLIELAVADLAPGQYRLWLDAGARRTAPVALTVVPRWLPRSGFFLNTMSCCIGAPPSDDAGLDALRAAGIEMTASVGHNSQLGINLPAIDARAASSAQARGLPVELALRTDHNDQMLDRMLRHRVRMVDEIVARGLHFYLEGLSYHHSYEPSVDRNVRRMHIFAQHTADFPSWMGGNASWFPTWWGYTEGGIPTDAHTGDRNAALAAACAAAGLVEPTAQERAWYDANMLAEDDETRAKADALRRRGVEFWKGREALAFGKHNRIYNRAIREVRPGTTCLLFENAGHDADKGTSALFTDMDAACYESYTDFGEWPMSAGWTTDHARGACPGQPVWITVDWGSSPEGQLKSLATIFARGAAGGAPPLPAEAGLGRIARMGTGMRFLAQYGAVATHAEPDQRVAVLRARGLKSGQYWECHALHYHLARLGCAPGVVVDDTVLASGIPAHVRALVIPRQVEPLDQRIVAAIAAFQDAGGKVIEPVGTVAPIDGAITVELPTRTLWELGGFQQKSHQAMWREFLDIARAPLGAALERAGIAPLVATDPERGLVFMLDGGAVRYAVVLADAKETRYADFTATEALPLTIAGGGWTVRDLAKQIDLEASEKDGATAVAVDLVTEPMTIVACYRSPPATVTARAHAGGPGGDLVVAAQVDDAAGAAMGAVPVALTVIDPSGRERDTVYRAAGEELRFAIAAREQPGTWRVRVQELLTGVATTIGVAVAPAAAAPTATLIDSVHVVDDARLRAFAARVGEKLVIVEPGQEAHLPLARRLVDAITAGGGAARLWQVRYQDYDGIPLRWYPRPADQAKMTLVDEAKLIGFRVNLEPYIDRREFAQVHVPEKGGWSDVSPSFLVGADCIVFSGGRLANSLRDVTVWMETANVPGKGQGRLVTVLSPFLADRHCTAVVANDAAGFAAATGVLAKALGDTSAAIAATTAPPVKLAAVDGAREALAVPRPYGDFTPVRRIQRLIANRAGAAVVGLQSTGDTAAFVDAAGAVTGTVSPAGGVRRYDRIDDAGALWHYASIPTAFHPSWHY